MANLGKCLLFYLKYPVEMERLYEAAEPKVEGLPDPDRTLQKITRVGDAAYREAVELLEACVPGIDEHFRFPNDWKSLSRLTLCSPRSSRLSHRSRCRRSRR
jgi:hypothetical protein